MKKPSFLAVFEKKKKIKDKKKQTNKQTNRTTRILKPREMMHSEVVVKEKSANTNIDCIELPVCKSQQFVFIVVVIFRY